MRTVSNLALAAPAIRAAPRVGRHGLRVVGQDGRGQIPSNAKKSNSPSGPAMNPSRLVAMWYVSFRTSNAAFQS